MLALLAALIAGGCAAPPAPRIDRLINTGWKFIREDVQGAHQVHFDDAAWQTVTLPHTWNNLDGQDGGDDYYRGRGWYRLRLPIPASYAGKSLFLRFDAAATVADVFVNGRAAGTHRGNFAAFCFDVTDLLQVGQDNLIAVRVDNSKFDDIAPLSGDFTIFGGLYRDVHLLALDPLSISPLDDASPGVYIKQARVDDARAEIEITTRLRNGSDTIRFAVVECSVLDGKKLVASDVTKKAVPARGGDDAVANLSIRNPRLWNGRADPHLYRAVVTVSHDGRVVDRITQPLGLRSYRVDPDRGLILNGRPYDLHGVNRHQDRIDMGWAIGPRQHDEDFALIREMGCTGVRLAHYQHHDYTYGLCDRFGLVVWAELALVNDMTVAPASAKAFADNAKQQLRELIKQNYNHPSILFWSLYNELAVARPDIAPEQTLVSELNDLAHSLDPTRLTAAATHKQKVDLSVNWIPDITAFNRYWGWYHTTPYDWPRGLDALRAAAPQGSRIGISEYGAGASVFQHELNPVKPRTGGPWHSEEWQCIVHEEAWRAMKQRPWLWCKFIWVGFDFAADQRKEGDQLGRNDKGLVTYDRQIRKDPFYFYKANWSDDPVLHIAARRFNPRPTGVSEIKVYSNCDGVELFINDESLGWLDANADRVYIWPAAKLREGENRIRAIGRKNGRDLSDEVTWNASRTATTRVTTTSPAAK